MRHALLLHLLQGPHHHYLFQELNLGMTLLIQLFERKKKKAKVEMVMGKYFLWTNTFFSSAKNNPFCYVMWDVVIWPGYKDPTYD